MCRNTPLRITAKLRTPVLSDATLPLDGILLYQAMRETYGPQDVTVSGALLDVPLVDLPLDRRGIGEHWYYACSFVHWHGTVTEGTDHWNKRFDNQHSGLVDFKNRRGKVLVEAGRYKSYHMPVFYRHALFVSWYAVGDADRIAALLRTMLFIGKKTSQGWGRVEWLIEPWHADWSEYDDGGKQMRALPDETGILMGIRPPYWLPEHQTVCRML
jgi:CRISPR type IV-associated protein Csf3